MTIKATFDTTQEAISFSETLYKKYGRDNVQLTDYPLFHNEPGPYVFNIDMKEFSYRYAIIRENISAPIPGRYWFIIKNGYTDGTEKVVLEKNTNDYGEIRDRAMTFISWWDYVGGDAKLMNGEIIDIFKNKYYDIL